MKRQHPDNPDLFWCNNCGEFKSRIDFYPNKSRSHCISSYCIQCCVTRSMEWNKHHISYKLRHTLVSESRAKTKQRNELKDAYIKQKLKHCGIPIDLESIELKRQQIIMKRTMKEFKKWRKENDPTITDVPGI